MDFAELAALASGHAEARAIQTALKLGIFDILEPAPLDDVALAAAHPGKSARNRSVGERHGRARTARQKQ
jgi:hypothetical protein